MLTIVAAYLMVGIGMLFICTVIVVMIRDLLWPHRSSKPRNGSKMIFREWIADLPRGIVISVVLSALACIGYGISCLPAALAEPAPTPTPTASYGRCSDGSWCERGPYDYDRGRDIDRKGEAGPVGPPGMPGTDGFSGTEPFAKPRLGAR